MTYLMGYGACMQTKMFAELGVQCGAMDFPPSNALQKRHFLSVKKACHEYPLEI